MCAPSAARAVLVNWFSLFCWKNSKFELKLTFFYCRSHQFKCFFIYILSVVHPTKNAYLAARAAF
jgi:hypothetical protein